MTSKGAKVDDRILPHDLDAETFLLEACCRPTGIERAADVVEPSDFFSEGGKLIFSKMMKLHQSGCGFTLYLIDQSFLGHPFYDGIRKVLDTLVPVTAECTTYYAKIIKKLSVRRQEIREARNHYESLYDPSNPIDGEPND